jgi:hypothetical protein
LTTQGQPPSEDYRMIEDLGFEVTGQALGAPEPCEDACSAPASAGTAQACGGGGCH